jgi:hypothetical protein
MTTQDKAQEIKESYNNSLTVKDCSLVAVDQIIEALSHNSWENRNELMFYTEVKEILLEL